MIVHQEQLTSAESGRTFSQELGLDLTAIQRQPGIFAKPYLDWTERSFHLASNLRKSFFQLCLEKSYLTRSVSHRSVTVTEAGYKQ
ncbi:ArsR family transcriptional regulator [Enterococcus faecalis]